MGGNWTMTGDRDWTTSATVDGGLLELILQSTRRKRHVDNVGYYLLLAVGITYTV